ncbi:MAG: hypothetical protein ACR2OD_06300, partial [Gaiellaceae bacterium]
MKTLLGLVIALVLATPAVASPGKVAIGVAPGSTPARVADAAEARTGGVASLNLAALDAITLRVEDVERSLRQLRSLPGTTYVERLDQPRRLAFTPNYPLVAEQWYL